jgi:outer membrane protein OmpA-like peptidoglycan-associated protein
MGLHPEVVVFAALATLAGCAETGFTAANDRTWGGELIEIPSATWVDPDGCEHWVFDTGLEGFMTPKLQRDGRPTCIVRADERGGPGLRDLTFGSVTSVFEDDTVDFSLAVDAYFDVDSDKLRPNAFPDLDAFFRYLQEIEVEAIYVEGHTVDQASTAYNLDLSLRRARAVADVAAQYGIFAIPGGMGDAKPAANNNSPQGRQRNRRVEIIILGDEPDD